VITHYTILGTSETATQAEIKTAYRALVKKIHPDTVDTLSPELRREAETVTQRIVEAYSVLSDAKRRREYDRELAEQRQKSIRASSSPATRTTPPRPGVRRRKWVVKVRRRWLNDPVSAGIMLVLLAWLAYYVLDLSLELVHLLNQG
jgi:curved DNA-binding protein CbpA